MADAVSLNRFDEKVRLHARDLRKKQITILQVNLGKLCNLTCVHCHVEAGPTKKKENMDEATAQLVVRAMDIPGISTLDLTGGAPEMNPHFRLLVTEARSRKIHVIDRCNLTILLEEGFSDTADFLASSGVEVIASLPCYQRENVDKQRGSGTFDGSVRALRRLNRLGYGREGTGLLLNLVYNPVGAHLPPAQAGLEGDYKKILKEDFDIDFNGLYTITNMPITRYEKYLKALNQYEEYTHLLVESFNPRTLDGLMCRDTLSVSWDGRIYDCDFNQVLGIQMRNSHPLMLQDVLETDVNGYSILTGDHCFGCTAGAGSSCQGALQ
ncbi:MAG: arsenosugar biosynthesis radical SAM protein ArsS [Candidatus Omnitrophota bacterium]|nr:arsenosugar biosynthesis radical SAM protein ArsS [Candidatus Omnitrophota bacterium]